MMISINRKYWILLLPLFVALFSCREKIGITLDSTYTRIVVEGYITDEARPHQVRLTLSTDFFYDEEPPLVTGAQAEITDGTQIFPLSEVSPGLYETDPSVKGVAGRTYTLTIRGVDVNNDGIAETYSATDLLKPVMVLDSVVVETQKPETVPPKYKVRGWGQEPSTPDDCYQWLYYVNYKLKTDTLYRTIFVDDTYVNGSYLPGLTMFMDILAAPGDTIKVETRSLSREYYTFLVTLMLESVWNQGGVAGPPANIKGNISNGGLGYFSAFSVSYISTIIQ